VINEDLVKLLNLEFPGRDQRARLGWYLSTDALEWVPSVDQNLTSMGDLYMNSLQRQTGMLADMWTWTLSDYVFDNPQSSCSAIVAMWRTAKEFNRPQRMYPRECYRGFAAPAQPDPVCGPPGEKELREGCPC
jgi:hypothetical protein